MLSVLENIELGEFDVSKSPLPTTTQGWFIEGLCCPMFGVKILRNHPNLTWYMIAPIMIQTCISAALLFILFLIGKPVVNWTLGMVLWVYTLVTGNEVAPDVADNLGFYSAIIVWVLIGVVFIHLFQFFWNGSGNILCGYFGGKLTDAAMRGLVPEKKTGYRTTVLTEAISAFFINITLYVGVSLLLAVTAIIPIIGQVIAVFLLGLWGAFVKGTEVMVDPFAHFGMNRTQTLIFCWKHHRVTVIAAGITKGIFEPIPFLGGVAIAAEDLGRIALAKRMIESVQAQERVPVSS